MRSVVPVALPTQRAYYLYDIDPGFSSFWNVRGWVLGAAIRQQLQRQYAEEWFREPDARWPCRSFGVKAHPSTFEDLVAQVNGSTLIRGRRGRRPVK